jgi:hypothetical protein
LTGHTPQTGDSYAIVNGDHGLVSIQDDVDEVLTRIPDATAGDAGGLFIAGSNAATTVASLTVTGLVDINDGVDVACTTVDRAAIKATGNGSGAGLQVVAGTGNALTVGVANIGNTTIGTVATGAVTKASEAITGALTVGDGVVVSCTTAGKAAIKATGNAAGAGMELVAGSGNALTVGVANIGNTTLGTVATGAVTKASEAITGALSVGTTTMLTGNVSLGGTLGVTGATTFTGAVTATNASNDIQVNTTKWLSTACATPSVAGVPEVDVTHLGGVAQSATDLKDFADTGYDPAAHKVAGVVLADTVTTLTNWNAVTFKRNTAVTGFTFIMRDSTNHAPSAGLTVTAQRSIDGAAFASCTNSVSEVSNGMYKINLSAGDLNGTTIMLRFTAAASDDTLYQIITQAIS